MTDLLLEATGVVKHYGAVAALRGASLAVRPGEVHALLGANGAGKSTFVKILTGAVRPDAGRFVVRGEERAIGAPAEARRAGLVSVYQEPSLIPDLEVAANLTLTATPLEPFVAWVRELGIPDLDLHALARELPLPTLRIIDLARALAAEPSVLLLDEMTAALPADLTERVIEVIRRQRGGERAIIFISHRLIEVTLLCDRATVLRDGETVGVLDVRPGVEDEILGLMLGPAMNGSAAGRAPAEPDLHPGRPATPATEGAVGPARLSIRNLRAGRKLQDVSFDARTGEVLGIVALEGQGQDELFAILSGAERPAGGEILVDGRPVRFGHPGDAIQAGLVYVPANRLEALLPQRSVHENIALPFVARPRTWGPIPIAAERRRVEEAIRRLQIDTRAGAEVRRLSGGNQQKVTIARWLAFGSRTLLCFDPTRGIDVRTKREIYQLLRELAAAGATVVLYTSELGEIALACDRAIAIFGGRVVGEVPASEADEETLLRVAHGLPVAADRDVVAPTPTAQPAGGTLV